MKATDILLKLREKFDTVHFATEEELSVILDSSDFPCVAVVPKSRTLVFRADQFQISENVEVVYLQKVEFDSYSEDIYNDFAEKEKAILSVLYPFADHISNYEITQGINKYDANVFYIGVRFDLFNALECL